MSDFNNILERDNEINPDLAVNNPNAINDEVDGAVAVTTNQDLNNATEEGAALGAAHVDIQTAKQKLLQSKVRHWGITFSDSDNMTRVKQTIPALDAALEQNMPKDPAAFETALEGIKVLYGAVIDACTTYVGNIKSRGRGKSKDGQTRLELTQQVLEHTRKEAGAFQVYAKDYFSEHGAEGNPWTSVLYQVRAKDIRQDTANLETVSGAISTVYKRTADGKTTYIKAEESIIWEGTLDSAMEQYLSSGAPKANETVEMYKAAKKDLGSEIQGVWTNVDKAFDEPTEAKSKRSHDEYVQYVKQQREDFLNIAIDHLRRHEPSQKYIDSNKELVKNFLTFVFLKHGEFGAAQNAGIAPGSIVSNRNVSTSRVAERLGVSDVVAKSETILMKGEDGSAIKANEMEEAYDRSLDDCLVRAKDLRADVEFTPTALRKSWELQVLDLICGQVDRHINNYAVKALYKKKEGRMYITDIKGFDNDMSFGVKSLSAMNKGTHAKALISGGKISIPCLPREFYERIMAYTPEEVAHDQLDIRSRAEIKSLQSRLLDVKRQLQKLVDDKKLELLDTEQQWIQAARDYYANLDNYAPSYVRLLK